MKTFVNMKALIRRTIYLLLLAGVGALVYVAMRPQPIDVDLVEVSRGRLTVTVREDGKTRIRERYVVSAPLSGRLLRVEMDPGDEVKRNASRLTVIQPRDPDLLNARERAAAESRVKAEETALKQAKPALERAKAQLKYAEADLGRLRKLVTSNAATPDEMERALMTYRMLQEEYRSATFAERIAEYELELAKAALLRTTEDGLTNFDITSPIDGRVLRVFQESATVVSPGTPLLEIGDPTDLEIEIDVLSSDAVKIRSGAKVFLERWGGDRALEGRVRLVEPSAFTKISALGVEEQRVNVIVDINDPPEDRPTLGDGFRVEAAIVIWEEDNVVRVPAGALFRDGEDWAVFAVAADDTRAEFRRLQLGAQNDLYAQVLEGLEVGEHVILHPSDKITDGTSIKSRASRESEAPEALAKRIEGQGG